MLSLILAAGLAATASIDWYESPTSELGTGNHRTQMFYHWPPDPVNVRTLNFYFPSTHMVLPCFFQIEIRAAYNSYSGDESVFGRKWTFNHNITVREAVTQIEVVEGDGYVNAYTRERNLEESTKSLISNIMVNLRKEDALNKRPKSSEEYKEIEKRLEEDKIYRQQMAKNVVKSARPLGPGEYFSLARGQSTLIKNSDGSYERRFQNGSKEFFNKAGRLTRSQDRNANFLTFIYTDNNLSKISDMCGRSVDFTYFSTPAARGLVRSITDSIGRSVTYNYDGNRQLVSYIDANKATHEFRYDSRGNMIEYKNSADASSNFSLTYNEASEVKSQLGPENNRTEHKRTFVANDRNNSITELQKFIGSESAGRELHEFKLGEYEIVTKFDKSGKETSKVTKRFSKQTGYPISILNSKGEGDIFEYDAASGNLISRENIISKEKFIYSYEPRCNQVSGLKITRPGGSERNTQYRFDDKCNVVEAVQTEGTNRIGWIEVKHNAQGRAAFLIDKQNNQQIAFTFWQFGKPESITLRDVGTLLVKYKVDGEMEEVKTRPHGKSEARFKGQDPAAYQPVILREVRTALDIMLGLLRPAGLTIGL